MVAALRRTLQARQGGQAVEVIETHISLVLLAGGLAYKLKKALNLGFLDFTTLAARQHFCAEELRLNRRLAPALYLGAVPITGSVAAPEIGGAGPIIDCAVEMRAFAQDGLWDRVAARGELRAAHVDELASLLSDFHRDATVAETGTRFGGPPQVRAPMLENLDALAGLLDDDASRSRLARLQAWEATAFAELEPAFAQRQRDGCVRECHGDLHLGNVTLIDGVSTVFDCIEFNDDFRWIDVVSDLAFMAMDLRGHGLPQLSHRFVNAYLQRSGDYAGARMLKYYLVHRALVRAKVSALRAGQAQAGATAPDAAAAARHFLELAELQGASAGAALMITHGLSGSGKTTQTQGLVETAGAIRVRADVERKRLHGLDELARSGSGLNTGLYSEAATRGTYARLCELAIPILQGGMRVVLDATFLRREQRQQACRTAAALGVPFFILDFDADLQQLRHRIAQRAAQGRDAAEADTRVLDAQRESAEPLAADELPRVIRCTHGGPGTAGAAASIDADWSALLRRLDGATVSAGGGPPPPVAARPGP